ncbi:MAG: alpha/beta fold hydrolase [Actinobacteria bacterium]|nr:alpha/beta fold hydrolase [Actinomycetota bacterium]
MTLDPGAGANHAPARPEKHFYRIGSFEPELGGYLEEVTLAYETWGDLDAAGENAVLVVHALTGDSHCSGGVSEAYNRGGWWRLLEDLGVRRLRTVIGGSIGGQQALEWAVEYPGFVEKVVPIAATGALGPQGLGMSEIGRRAIMADPDWHDGDYYDTDRSPETGLAIARMAGMMTYQSAEGQWQRFGRDLASRPALYEEFGGRFEVESYLHYQGRDLAGRFDANSYLYLTRAMDIYDVGAEYTSREEAYARIEAEMFFVGISSDWLFPAAEVRAAAEKARSAGTEARYEEIQSPNGHDAFLKDWDELRAAVGPFLSE